MSREKLKKKLGENKSNIEIPLPMQVSLVTREKKIIFPCNFLSSPLISELMKRATKIIIKLYGDRKT
jgi:hypothetical protein